MIYQSLTSIIRILVIIALILIGVIFALWLIFRERKANGEVVICPKCHTKMYEYGWNSILRMSDGWKCPKCNYIKQEYE